MCPDFQNRGAAPKAAPVSRHPARIALPGVLAIVRPQHFLTSREVCFFPSVLRFRFGRRPLAAERRLPSSVLGPVDNPPCRRHRPLPYRSFRLQGVPALVLAPHVWPGKVRGGGSGASLSSCAAHRIPAHRSSMLLASVLFRTGIPYISPSFFWGNTVDLWLALPLASGLPPRLPDSPGFVPAV